LPFPLGPALLGGAGLIGNLISGLFGSSAQDKANETNLRIARENRDWQENMSNTAYQRATTDMKQAGLNPIMSVMPASSPGGSTADVDPVNPMSGMAGLAGSVGTALDAARLGNETKAVDAKSALDSAAAMTEVAKAKATDSSARESQLRGDLLNSTMGSQVSQEKYKGEQAEADRKMLEYDNIMKRVQQGVGIGSSALDMVDPLKGLLKGKGSSGWSGKSKDLFDYMNRRP